MWKSRAWPVDHGIALPFHFGDEDPVVAAAAPLALSPDHVFRGSLGAFDGRGALTSETIESIVRAVPPAWAPDLDVYRRYLSVRALRRD